jgi:HEAT repeat protein
MYRACLALAAAFVLVSPGISRAANLFRGKPIRDWIRIELSGPPGNFVGVSPEEGRAALPELLNVLKGDSSPEYRAVAALFLSELTSQSKEVVPALVEALDDPEAGVRESAARALGYFGPDAGTAVGSLVEALKDQQSSVRLAAAETLGNLGAEARIAVPDLAAALKDESSSIREAAAEALGKLGTVARAAVPELKEALKDPKTLVRGKAREALDKINRGEP